jgi:DNA-binding CsgD family transcriptional regulator
VTVWATIIDLGPRRYELAWVSTDPPGQPSPLKQYLGSEPVEMTVGTVGPDWRILTISSEAERILGTPADAMVGMRLVARMPQADVDHLVAARELVEVAHSVALKIRWAVDDELRELTCLLTRPTGMRDLGFMLVPEVPEPPDQDHRTADLERHLVKIAGEVEASGVLDRFFALPDLAQLREQHHLSVRQWEIMSRLLQGERVPTIATGLFLSQSTVRNQLSMIYRRFGVHSQAELLALLANRRPGSAQN